MLTKHTTVHGSPEQTEEAMGRDLAHVLRSLAALGLDDGPDTPDRPTDGPLPLDATTMARAARVGFASVTSDGCDKPACGCSNTTVAVIQLFGDTPTATGEGDAERLVWPEGNPETAETRYLVLNLDLLAFIVHQARLHTASVAIGGDR